MQHSTDNSNKTHTNMNLHTKSLQVFESCSPAKTQNKIKNSHMKKKINTNLNMLNAGNRETQIPRDCSYTQGKKKRNIGEHKTF